MLGVIVLSVERKWAAADDEEQSPSGKKSRGAAGRDGWMVGMSSFLHFSRTSLRRADTAKIVLTDLT